MNTGKCGRNIPFKEEDAKERPVSCCLSQKDTKELSKVFSEAYMKLTKST